MTFEPLSTSLRGGVIAVSVISLLSSLALVFVAFRTIQLAIVFLNPDDRPSRLPEMLLFFRYPAWSLCRMPHSQ
ncbi:hypothetical protein JVU11DRAFT_4412 [Chiua virens]|nr:hypothetical protein JVU11DRAFT_4412 [Chiua virens]